MLNYTFVQSVKVLTGKGSINNIGEACKDHGYKKAFLVFDKGIKSAGVVDKIESALEAKGVSFVEYNKVLPDPPSDMIDEGAELCKKEGCDCVIAIGGGSSIDAGKGINILRFNDGKILDYVTKEMKHCSGLITVPTTSGTGSELSNGAIVSDSKTGQKIPVLCFNNMSEITVLDPELTAGMPYKLTLLTGLDVFSHCVEAYTANSSNPMTDLLCEKMIATVHEYLPKVLENPTDLDAREKMQCAASIGGWMLYNCCAHVGHSIAHVLGGYFHLIHGQACALGLPPVLKLISSAVPDKVKYIGEVLGAEFSGLETNEEIGEKAAKAYIEFSSSLKLPQADFGEVSDEEFNALVDMVVNEPFAGFTPVKIDSETATKLLKEVIY